MKGVGLRVYNLGLGALGVGFTPSTTSMHASGDSVATRDGVMWVRMVASAEGQLPPPYPPPHPPPHPTSHPPQRVAGARREMVREMQAISAAITCGTPETCSVALPLPSPEGTT